MDIRIKKYLIMFILNFSIFFNYSFAQQGWYNLNTSFEGAGIYFKDVNNGIVGNYKSSNGGISWNFMGFGSGGNSLVFPNQNTGYGVDHFFYSHSIFKTTNFGDNWITQTPPVLGLKGVYFPNVNTGYACGEYSSIIKTTNGGNNWYLLNTPLLNSYIFLSIFFTDTITGYIVGHRYANDTSMCVKTTNGGINWLYKKFAANEWGKFTSLFFINANTGIVGSTGYILKTTDAGLNWYALIIPTQNKINSLYFPSASTGYGSCYGGQIIKTTDGGDNWFLQNTGTGSILYSIFFVNNLTGYASGDNNAVLKTTDGGGPPIGIIPISNNIPEKYQLFQNYPNPFNPVTKIKFAVPLTPQSPLEGGSGVTVRLLIYDILGREVAVLVNEQLKPGTYEVEFEGTKHSSGIYFYKLICNEFVETKKMVLIK